MTLGTFQTLHLASLLARRGPCILASGLSSISLSSTCLRISTRFFNQGIYGKATKMLTFSGKWRSSSPCLMACSRMQAFHMGQPLGRTTTKMILPFEADAKVKADTIVYSYSNDRLFRLVTFFGIAQFVFWCNLALFAYSSLDAYDASKKKGIFKNDSLWGQILDFQSKYRYKMAVVCMILGYMVGFFTWIYPQRAISKLVLLRGGQNVKISTYYFFGRQRSFTVPLKDINCKHVRQKDARLISLKIKGHIFYFSLDNAQGRFMKPHLFDTVIGLKRNL